MNRIISFLLPPRHFGRFRPLSRSNRIFHRRLHLLKHHKIEGVEPFANYVPGGYHPVHIGDQLHSRYSIVNKIGHGSCSTVWLARDKCTNKLVAVKVVVSDIRNEEANIKSALSVATGSSFFPPALDHFTVRGPNGVHQCYVMEPAICNLEVLREGPRYLEPNTVRSLVAQLILSMATMHRHGFIHGEFVLKNILLRFPSGSPDLTDRELREKWPEKPKPVDSLDGSRLPPNFPSYGYIPIILRDVHQKLSPQADIWVAGLTETFVPSAKTRKDFVGSLTHCAPEFLFAPQESELSFSSDIWALACSIWHLLGESPLSPTFLCFDEEDTMGAQVDLLGLHGLPSSWRERWETHSEFVMNADILSHNQSRAWNEHFESSIQQLRKENRYWEILPEEKEAIIDMLQPMLAWKPEDRCTAAQVAESKWMTQWGLPRYKKAMEQGIA
ncbi:kinase-like protein [Daldinia sp. FL1419]|nr:kinase-like protein [Daldinia sp. FL1419]